MVLLINGKTKVIGFLGSTYQKSKVYPIYNKLFQKLNLNYVFVPFVATDIAKATESIRALGIHACGVTTPFKEQIFEYLDEISAEAKKIGAVNVVVNNNGVLIGENTDGAGAAKALKERTIIDGKTICLIGAGGVAKAIALTLQSQVRKINIVNIDDIVAMELANDVGDNVEYWPYDERNEILAQSDIIINATTVGMLGGDNEGKSLVAESVLKSGMTVMDVVVVPRQTKLIKDALFKGCNVVYGERMLFWQAFYKFRFYTGVTPAISIMENLD
jgi:shikimate dehydrogenase